jgi:hypothetical protein
LIKKSEKARLSIKKAATFAGWRQKALALSREMTVKGQII